MRIPVLVISPIAAALTLTTLSPAVQAKNKKKAPLENPRDAIQVVGHIAPGRGTVTRFVSTQHYSSYYLYVEHEGGMDLTLIDVSKIAQPVVVAEVPAAPNGGAGTLFAVAGTAALITEQTLKVPVATPQTMRIMDFSNPKQPKIAREFAGVTAMSRDERRRLIFIANPDGIWILHQSFAEDPEAVREYERNALYAH